MDRNDLISTYQELYHLTAREHWKSVLEHGLLSAIDLAAVCGLDRDDIIGKRRATCKQVSAPNSSLTAAIRDQEPLVVDKLVRYIEYQGNRITLERWLERQSERVFFFVSEVTAGRMAAKYEKKGQSQVMIVVNTKSLVNAYHDKIDLSAYNSGFNRTDPRDPANRRCRHKLYHEMFLPIDEYPYDTWCDRRSKETEYPIVEVTVRGRVSNMTAHVERVVEMNGKSKGREVYSKKVGCKEISDLDEGRCDAEEEDRKSGDDSESESKRDRELQEKLFRNIKRPVREKLEKFHGARKDRSGEWLERAVDSVEFIRCNYDEDEDIIVFATNNHFFVHAVLVPLENVANPDHDDLKNFDIWPNSCWSVCEYPNDGKSSIELRDPFHDTDCNTLRGGEKLIFARDFHGTRKNKLMLEVSQKFFHSLDLYYISEKRAYCTVDDVGNVKEIICIYSDEDSEFTRDIQFVTVKREYLNRYLALTETSMVSNFLFNRYNVDDEDYVKKEGKRYYDEYKKFDLYYSKCIVKNDFSLVRGHIIYRTNETKESFLRKQKDMASGANRKYETFIIYDLKSRRVMETSCDPASIADYFIESDLPLSLSPAFFRDDVLIKYQSQPEKYIIEDNTITCVGAWSLRSFGRNDEHQVHVPIVDLADLPFEEQKYWKAFNVEPKDGISKSSFENDILGKFSSEENPLEELKDIVRRLDREEPAWWNRRGNELIDGVQLTVTESIKPWGDSILALNKMVVEGFSTTRLKRIIAKIDKPIERGSGYGSVKILEMIISCLDENSDKGREVCVPLRELIHLRNTVQAHDGGSERQEAISKMKKDFGDTRLHFSALVFRVRDSMTQIEEYLKRVSEEL